MFTTFRILFCDSEIKPEVNPETSQRAVVNQSARNLSVTVSLFVKRNTLQIGKHPMRHKHWVNWIFNHVCGCSKLKTHIERSGSQPSKLSLSGRAVWLSLIEQCLVCLLLVLLETNCWNTATSLAVVKSSSLNGGFHFCVFGTKPGDVCWWRCSCLCWVDRGDGSFLSL